MTDNPQPQGRRQSTSRNLRSETAGGGTLGLVGGETEGADAGLKFDDAPNTSRANLPTAPSFGEQKTAPVPSKKSGAKTGGSRN